MPPLFEKFIEAALYGVAGVFMVENWAMGLLMFIAVWNMDLRTPVRGHGR